MTREEFANETPREDLMREALKHYEELATKACWHRSDIPAAIRAYYVPLPPAEGAECSHDYVYKIMTDHTAADVCTKCGNIKKQIAEGAVRHLTDDEIEKHGMEGGLRDGELQMYWEGATWYRSYAQKIADKMVSERCAKCKYRGLPDSINEALNSGDGVYRP